MFRSPLCTALLALIVFSCGGQSQADECEVDKDCGPEAFCMASYSEAGGCGGGFPSNECKPRLAEGEACHDDFGVPCVVGLVCHGSFGKTCQTASALGGACTDAEDCGGRNSNARPDDPVCDVSGPAGICAGPGMVPEGGRCLESRACGEGFACRGDGPERFCVGPARPGEPCGVRSDQYDDIAQCEPGWCEPQLGICQPPGDIGDSCDRTRICEEGLVCAVDGEELRCALPAPEGGPCSWPGECEAGLSCFDGSCAPPHGEGGHCEYVQDCAEGLSCDWNDRVCVTR